jgi:hypothetical protein
MTVPTYSIIVNNFRSYQPAGQGSFQPATGGYAENSPCGGVSEMAEKHSPADDIVYDLVSIQYHALKGATLYAKYAADAEGHDDVRAFIEEVRDQDAKRAVRVHELLGALTAKGGIG